MCHKRFIEINTMIIPKGELNIDPVINCSLETSVISSAKISCFTFSSYEQVIGNSAVFTGFSDGNKIQVVYC